MTGRRPRAALAAALAFSLLLPGEIDAQYDEPPPPAAYALEGVTLVEADGSRTDAVTIVVRGSFVEVVEAGAEVPADARVLEGEGLRVYPGLVDAWGRAQVDLPSRPDPDDVTAWKPSRLARGFTPHLRIATHLTATGATLRKERAAGVVASGVFPTRGFAAGLGAALLHRIDAETARELVARPEVGLTLSFQGTRGAYPSTLFGVIADLRQSFSDAQRLALLEREYGQNPSGLTLPPWDPDHEVLRRVAGAGLPAFFLAWEAEDIRRVLGLASEVGFSPVIVGGGQAWKVADALAASNVPVLASVDFPEARHWSPEEEPGPDEELDPRAARERDRLVDLYANAGRLVEAGVTVALTSGGGHADLRKGARKAIEYGLSEEAALSALTATPAELLGIGPVSRIAPGWGATFVVTDGPLFADGTRILYTFVEGRLQEMERDEEPPPVEEPPAVDVTGEWVLVLESQEGRTEYSMTLEQEGGRVTGTATAPGEPTVRIRRGTVSGNEIEVTFIVQGDPETGDAQASAVVVEDRMEGSGSGFMGDFELTATREPGDGSGEPGGGDERSGGGEASRDELRGGSDGTRTSGGERPADPHGAGGGREEIR